MGSVFAVSDLHVAYPENRRIAEDLRPEDPGDWLLVAGDVAEVFTDVRDTLARLNDRFARVIWAPGNHELWTHGTDPNQSRGVARYDELVAMCREIGVLTPEDEYAVWEGDGGPVTIAPLFVLYDYTWRAPGTTTKEESLKYAYDTGVVCTDEMVLHPDPYPDRESWCRDRLAATERRLAAIPPDRPTVLVSHWPLIRRPTEVLYYPEFAQWCGTEGTADWHRRFRAVASVYGHLHIPRTIVEDGVRFEEVSLGYPREWGRRATAPRVPVRILPAGDPR
jgi:3',5'-cyclic AMP phosphodiesterase CpdA